MVRLLLLAESCRWAAKLLGGRFREKWLLSYYNNKNTTSNCFGPKQKIVQKHGPIQEAKWLPIPLMSLK